MPSLADQISAVLSAPIPFLITLIAFGIVVWRVFEWRYRAVIGKMKELSELSRTEVAYWKDTVDRTAKQGIEELKNKDLGKLEQTLSAIPLALNELDKANTIPIINEWTGRHIATLVSAPDRPTDKKQSGLPHQLRQLRHVGLVMSFTWRPFCRPSSEDAAADYECDYDCPENPKLHL
jgi:hypothetical protein